MPVYGLYRDLRRGAGCGRLSIDPSRVIMATPATSPVSSTGTTPLQPTPPQPSSLQPTPAMVATGKRLAEARLRPDGGAVGWVQRGDGAADLVMATLDRAPSDAGGANSLIVGAHTVLPTVPPIVVPHPSGGGAWCWLPDGSGVIYASRSGLHLASVDGEVSCVLATPDEGRQLWSPAVDPTGTLLAFVNEGAGDAYIAVLTLPTRSHAAVAPHPDPHPDPDPGPLPTPTRVSPPEADSFVIDPEWGTDGFLAWHTWAAPAMPWDHGRIDLAAVEQRGSAVVVIARGSLHGGRVGQPRWSENRLSWIDDASGFATVSSGRARLVGNEVLIDVVQTISDSSEHSGPTWGPGQRTTAWCPGRSLVAFDRNEAGFGRLCVAAPGATEHVGGFAGRPLGRGVHGSLSWVVSPDGHDRIAAIRQGATTPVQVVVYHRPASARSVVKSVGESALWERTVVAESAIPGWEQIDLVEPIEVAAPAEDGTLIHGRLYRPHRSDQVSSAFENHESNSGLATIVAIHGGPTDQSRVEWNPRFAAYVASGWQVLVVDHRGSTGWGREYQQAMNEQWGLLDVSDTVSVLRSLIATGRVDASRVVASGGSAGGFTVLSLLITHPDLFAGGIALYPVTDLIALDATTHRFEAHYQRTLIGQRPAHERRYIERSPITHARHLRVPLLLFHGTDDKVVDVAQTDALVAAITDAHLGVSPQYVRFEGEGHGWSKPETTATEHARVMAFLASI